MLNVVRDISVMVAAIDITGWSTMRIWPDQFH
jgi:hypothetical protein